MPSADDPEQCGLTRELSLTNPTRIGRPLQLLVAAQQDIIFDGQMTKQMIPGPSSRTILCTHERNDLGRTRACGSKSFKLLPY